MLNLRDFELNKTYNANEIYNYVHEEIVSEEHGEFTIGKNFWSLYDIESDFVVAFILVAYNVNGSIYKCVFKG